MAEFQGPPTYAEIVLTDEKTKKSTFNPVWLSWFLQLVQTINAGGGVVAQHNSLSGIQGGAASQRYHVTLAQNTLIGTLTAGTYTPTLTNVTNLDGSTAYLSTYIRLSDTVFVFGKVDVNPTAGAATELGISLPVASNIGAQEDCCGVAFATGIAGQGAGIRGDAANNRASMNWIAVDVTNQPMYFVFGYRII